MDHAITQQAHARSGLAHAFDHRPHFEAFGTIDQARHHELFQIHFIASARETHRQRPDLDIVGAQERHDARRLAAVLVAVGNEQNLALASLADLRQRRLQRCLHVGFIAIEAGGKIKRGHALPRQRLPLRRPPEG
jgi:hypothetical protein